MKKLAIAGWFFTLSLISMAQMSKNIENQMNAKYNLATFGGGCFWCTEAVFEEVKGVISVVSGYSGGFIKNPSYREVCNGNTGHAEVVQVKFDSSIISYKEILDIFFHTHDPTSMNRQGADVGTQYRSIILYHALDQKAVAEEKIRELNLSGTYSTPVVTQIEPFTVLYIAEEYHQDYFKKNPNASYCSFVVKPKVDKLKKNYSDMLKK